ncbi:MAG: glycosyltransferase [Gammaproteobacteria bacterium]
MAQPAAPKVMFHRLSHRDEEDRLPETDLKLSVIVPAYNSAPTLPACLDALLRARQHILEAEIIVVDDASTDATAAIASRYGIHLLEIRCNGGPAAARNLGAAHATGGILVFVDADVAISEDALERIAEHFRKASGAALIGSYDSSPREKNLTSRYRNLLHHFVHQHAPECATHFWTGLGAIRKPVFDSFGGFDEEHYGRGCEDIELGYRLRAAGHSIAVDKSLQGKHLKRWTLGSMVRTDLLVRAIPWTRLLIQYKRIPNDFSLGLAQRVSVALSWLSLTAALAFPSQPFPLMAALLLFVGINWPFFRFLETSGGALFSAACLPLHLLYHFISGAGFLIGIFMSSPGHEGPAVTLNSSSKSVPAESKEP